MTTLSVRLGSMADFKAEFVEAVRRAESGEDVETAYSLEFASYEHMHSVLAPARLDIVKALARQGLLSTHEVSRRANRDVQAVNRDVTTLINAGVIDRTESGIEFPYDGIHFEFDMNVTA
ncbi:putative transcriptional regulator [Sinorhizobium fredii]|nr:hypothetical protein [Sinorhizobium fredii]